MDELGPTLEVSVSFGKYENDEISWGKWSSFSPNKYLEEADKCKTSGSVAQKKAYFEAHYKKIATQKMEQEKMEQVESLDEPHILDRSESTHVFDTERYVTQGEEEMTRADVNNSDSVDMEVNSLLVLKDKEGEILETSDHGEVPNVEQHKSCEIGSQDNLKEISQVDSEAKSFSAKKSKTPKSNLKNTARKVHPTTEDRISAGTKKKLASPVTKSSRISTPMSKPTPPSKVISSSQTSVKKVNEVSYQRSSDAPIAQSNKLHSRSLISPSQSNKKVERFNIAKEQKFFPTREIAPTSLHMSLSLGPPNSTASTNDHGDNGG
ncbi:hypothetical protein R3W88_010575 [Solanum pinnatisectum]|uniref:Protein WVD2-like 7 n=1 Tax=Solanum pinnatisectum TaxID=50273 RepID=A0AAV9L7Q9_9SOLN|nr:hypothetical protein R3W88_010575 [Solanum pinnatisectum]